MRQVIKVPGLGHGDQPIPLAVRIGPMLATGTISGIDRSTGAYPMKLTHEVDNAFTNLVDVLTAGGMKAGDLLRVTVYLRDRADRETVNRTWLGLFPDSGDRPARHTVEAKLPASMRVQLEALAWSEARQPT